MILVVQSEDAWDSVALFVGCVSVVAPVVATDDSSSLVVDHLPLVRSIVEKIRNRIPMHVNADDLYSAGVEGLLAAARKYEPSRGKFAFYASVRIRGMILDELRRLDVAPRRARLRIRKMSAARDELSQSLGRAPTDAEMAAKLGLDSREYRRWAADSEPVTLVPLDATVGDDGEGAQIHELLADTEAVDVRQSMEHGEEIAIALRRVGELPAPQRKVIREYYFDGRRLGVIAERMGLTESRVCQIRQEAITALRHSVGKESNHVAVPNRPEKPVRAKKVTDDSEEDAELVRRTLAGDTDAFTFLMGKHRDRLYSVALNLIKRPQDAEEIVQDTFVRALRALPRFRGDSSVSTWLTRITMNLSKNRWWYNRRRMGDASLSLDCALSDDSDETFSALISDVSPGPARELANSEFAAIIARCMGGLSERQRHILTLRGTLHRSYEEISSELGVNVGTVKSRLARAREELRRLILAECPDLSGIDSWVEPDRDGGAVTKA